MVSSNNLSARLTQRLAERGFAAPEKIQACFKEAEQARKSFIEVLYEKSGISEKDLMTVRVFSIARLKTPRESSLVFAVTMSKER
jgi:hypothetical protein